MTMDDYKSYWREQSHSGQREDSTAFLDKKAREHAQMVKCRADGDDGIIDLGCGAGELLLHLSKYIEIDCGIDFSETMLDRARQRLAGTGIRVEKQDIFSYLPIVSCATWITTQALNQYLDADEIKRMFSVFIESRHARALYLFDCVDPIRYIALQLGSRYSESDARVRGVIQGKRDIAAFLRLLKIVFGNRNCVQWKSTGMGFAYTPAFWRKLVGGLGEGRVSVEIESSKYYEYRYHVICRKECDKSDRAAGYGGKS